MSERMYFCPECGQESATEKGSVCADCGGMETEEYGEYLMTSEGRAELLGQNDLSPDFYGEDSFLEMQYEDRYADYGSDY